MADDKKDPELYDQETGRERAASGFPAPTTEEAYHELGIIKRMMDNHGCPTTRDLVSAASVIVDVAHKDAHSFTSEDLQTQVVEFGVAIFDPLQAAIKTKATSFEKLEDRAKFYARITSILLQIARVSGVHSLNLIKEVQDSLPKVKEELEATPAQIAAVVNASSPEDAIKNLLDTPVKSRYNH